MRGDQSNYSNVGNYEFVNIVAINEDNIEVDEIKNIYGAISNDDLYRNQLWFKEFLNMII